MKIRLPKRVFERLTDEELKAFEWDRPYLRGLDSAQTDLKKKSKRRKTKIRAALERLSEEGTRKLGPIISDIDRWERLINEGGIGSELPKTMQEFADLATEYIRTAAGRRVFVYDDEEGRWYSNYVNFIEFHPEREARWNERPYEPPYVEINLLYWELGFKQGHSISLEPKDVDGMTVKKALAIKGVVIETDDLRRSYLKEKCAFDAVWDRIGTQYLSEGFGTEESRYGRYRTTLMSDGQPAKLVLDVVKDPDERNRDRLGNTGQVKPNFWHQQNPKAVTVLDRDSLGQNRLLEGEKLPEEDVEPPEIPIKATVVVYHLVRNVRYLVNAADLQLYEFDKELHRQLILPESNKNLVDVLVGQGKVSFSDIVAGKGSGACVLLGGPPGVGKTLTAEVFAESTERPLLSVHAAQLGASADDIESNLRKVLRRGSRWNAVVLLDEADVYINERGSSLQQNAIVAAFLRVLEQHTATIFMTTNRMDRVDDAVISRCLARIDYELPSAEDQHRIWRVMSDLNEIDLNDCQIAAIVKDDDGLSGRDIKQLLKLAALWGQNHGTPVSRESIRFVRQFLPTRARTVREGGGADYERHRIRPAPLVRVL